MAYISDAYLDSKPHAGGRRGCVSGIAPPIIASPCETFTLMSTYRQGLFCTPFIHCKYDLTFEVEWNNGAPYSDECIPRVYLAITQSDQDALDIIAGYQSLDNQCSYGCEDVCYTDSDGVIRIPIDFAEMFNHDESAWVFAQAYPDTGQVEHDDPSCVLMWYVMPERVPGSGTLLWNPYTCLQNPEQACRRQAYYLEEFAPQPLQDLIYRVCPMLGV